MPGTPRNEDELADLTAAAREMREGGMAMHEISHELAVPVSTLYQWAAQGRWRLKDIAAARMRAVFASQTLSSRAEDGPRPSADPGPREGDEEVTGETPRGPGSPLRGVRDDTEGEADTTPPPPLTPLDARAAGERAFKGAMALMEAGELKSAGEAMRLAERMLLAARLLEGLPLPADEKAGYLARRAALEAKITRLLEAERAKEARDAETAAASAPGGYWPPGCGADDLDAQYGFTEPQTGEQSGPGPAS